MNLFIFLIVFTGGALVASLIIAAINKEKRNNSLLLAAFIGITFASSLGLYQNDKRAQEGADAKAAICAIATDLQNRIAQSQFYIKNNPEILKTFGISKAQALNNINNQRRTLSAINSSVKCEGVKQLTSKLEKNG